MLGKFPHSAVLPWRRVSSLKRVALRRAVVEVGVAAPELGNNLSAILQVEPGGKKISELHRNQLFKSLCAILKVMCAHIHNMVLCTKTLCF
jgi:hypothetical protein